MNDETAVPPAPAPAPVREGDGITLPEDAITVGMLTDAFLQDYELREFRTLNTARGRVVHLLDHFGRDYPAAKLTSVTIRDYQRARRQQGAAPATVNRETTALMRMFNLAVQWGWLSTVPVFPGRLRESEPRQGFFEHHEYIAVRAELPPPFQDVLDFAYYSGWRKREILDLCWDEVDLAGGVIRLRPDRSKTLEGRVLPLSTPLRRVLERRRQRCAAGSPLVFQRDGVPVRTWKTAWRRACERAGVPARLLHDCRRTAARNLVRAGVPERVAMVLTGHKTRSVFDRYNIVNERELLAAGEKLAAYVTSNAST